MSDQPLALSDRNPAQWWAWFTAAVAKGEIRYSDTLAKDLIVFAQSGAVNPGEMPFTFIGLLRTTNSFARIWTAAEANDAASVEALARRGEIAAACDNELARFLLANFIIPSAAAELIFTIARRTLLFVAVQNPKRPPEDTRVLLYALAQQCFLNEYAYWHEPDEAMWVEVLASNVEAMVEEADPNADVALATLACYRPLVPWPSDAALRLDALRSADQGFHEMRARLVDEPRVEQSLAAQIPALTPIEDGTSQAVRSLYEENPYPRWRLPVLPATQPTPKATLTLFPGADMKSYGDIETPRILIAGCGTGQFLAFCAKLFASAEITAIDLSRTSLAYAKRQMDALGISVAFAQADIIALDPSRFQFDIIECSGVLHHTADVAQSWRALNACLRPGGLITVALYNRGARDWLDAPRRLARLRGNEPTAQHIRRFRRDVLQEVRQPGVLPSGLNEIVLRPDFYSLSQLRDACFHVQEQEFSIREIAALTEQVGLRFLGLHLWSAGALAAYRRDFPDDPYVRNIAAISLVEQSKKDAFGPMYAVCAQRPA